MYESNRQEQMKNVQKPVKYFHEQKVAFKQTP